MSWTNSAGDPIPGATSGDDSYAGTDGTDTASGLDGNDTLSGNGGDVDYLFGNAGDDVLIGGDGIDSLIGGEGDDSLLGGAGDDYLLSDAGSDTFVGGDGTDFVSVFGGAGPFSVDGGGGFDFIVVDKSSATSGVSYTVDGSGIVAGGDGSHGENTEYLEVIGSAHADTFSINSGSAQIYAGDGNDLIQVGANTSILVDAGSGSDTLDLAGWNTADNPWTSSTDPVFPGYTVYTNSVTGAQMYTSGVEVIVCFAEGTRILTPRGEVPVETLRAGDLVVTPYASRRVQPLHWVGHRHIDCAAARDRSAAAPIRLRAGSLGSGMPCRDLRVSPEHAFLLDGRLVPARLLVDGVEIVQETWCPGVTYWHLELEAHGILVADGAYAESYFDDGSRHFLNNPGLVALRPIFDRTPGGRYASEAYAPPVLDAGDPALTAILQRRRSVA